MRSSVDHGTAFDIAGTGKAGTVSMLESTLVAARYWKNEASIIADVNANQKDREMEKASVD